MRDIPFADRPWTLVYHAIADHDEDPHRIQVTPGAFRQQMAWLRRHGRRGVDLATLLATPPDRRAGLVGLTFDDGYTDFAHQAVPILEANGFTATVYVVADRLGATNDWDTGPVRGLMTADEIRDVARRGMEVGSHTLTHARLPLLAEEDLVREVGASRAALDDVLGARGSVTGFAYPYGDLGEREVAAVEAAGYTYATGVARGAEAGRFAVPRTYVGQADTAWRLRAKRVRHHYRTWRVAA